MVRSTIFSGNAKRRTIAANFFRDEVCAWNN
jgi:hypothetical protein